MKIDAGLALSNLREAAEAARRAEAIGFDAVWTAETQHEAFLPLPLIAEHTSRIQFGTAIAVAFARSPMILAHTAWDLSAQSGGRFILGLGTQVKAHIERRFGMTWEAPAPKLREMIRALRAIWDGWQIARCWIVTAGVKPVSGYRTWQPGDAGTRCRSRSATRYWMPSPLPVQPTNCPASS